MTLIKLVIGVPTSGRVSASFAYSLAGMIAKVAADKIPTMPEATVTLAMQVVESSNWIENREQIAAHAISSGMTHLMFIDDDMSFEPQVLEIMLGRRQPVVCTNYLIKTEPKEQAEFVAVGLDGRRIVERQASTGIQPIMYSGFGVSLFETAALARVPQPRFQLDWNEEEKRYTTEDNPFYRRIREAGATVYLDHDASKLIAHHGMAAWHWHEVKHG